MTYCTLADVAALMNETWTETSRPTRAEVETMCEEVSAELDGVAQAAGYDTPITGADGLALFKRYASFGVAPQAWYARYSGADEPAKVAYWRTTYADFVARLRRGEQLLPAEPVTGAAPTAFSVGTKRADGYTDSLYSESHPYAARRRRRSDYG
jgi:hypothetical protein